MLSRKQAVAVVLILTSAIMNAGGEFVKVNEDYFVGQWMDIVLPRSADLIGRNEVANRKSFKNILVAMYRLPKAMDERNMTNAGDVESRLSNVFRAACDLKFDRVQNVVNGLTETLSDDELKLFASLLSKKYRDQFAGSINDDAAKKLEGVNVGYDEKFSTSTNNDIKFSKKFNLAVDALRTPENQERIKCIKEFFIGNNVSYSKEAFNDDIIEVLLALENLDSPAVISFFEMLRLAANDKRYFVQKVSKLEYRDNLIEDVPRFLDAILSASDDIEDEFRVSYGSLAVAALSAVETAKKLKGFIKRMTPRAAAFLLDFL
ncbi:hypothetical protein HOD08_04260, partial [bacterium]|nr:hypothetical protein [bacterium]